MIRQAVDAAHPPVRLGVGPVQRHRDVDEAGGDRLGEAFQPEAAGQKMQADPARAKDIRHLHQVRAEQRLAPGEHHDPGAEGGQRGGQPLELVEGEIPGPVRLPEIARHAARVAPLGHAQHDQRQHVRAVGDLAQLDQQVRSQAPRRQHGALPKPLDQVPVRRGDDLRRDQQRRIDDAQRPVEGGLDFGQETRDREERLSADAARQLHLE
jgi:hypothetical protein